MKEKLVKFDKGLARGEAAIAMIVLLALVGVAAAQSFLRNIADAEVTWANDALLSMTWADPFMEKATLWLAMLGASLATHYDKHIGIDIIPRLVKPKARAAMRGIVSLFAGITSFYFARVVLGAVMVKAGRIPGEYAVYNSDFETIHICLGEPADLARATVSRPDLFCSARGFFEGLGMTVNTPERMMDLLVPAMFVIIAVRLSIIGIGAFMRIPEGGIPDSELGGSETVKGAASVAGVPVDEGEKAMGGVEDSEADEPSAEKKDAGKTGQKKGKKGKAKNVESKGAKADGNSEASASTEDEPDDSAADEASDEEEDSQ